MVLSVVALLLRFRTGSRATRSLLNVTCFLGIGLVILSATPLPYWAYGSWLVIFIVGLFLCGSKKFSGLRKVVSVLFTCSSLAMYVVELPYHLRPSFKVFQNQPIFVLGDSISAGIENKEHTWPGVLGDLSHLKVTNLAEPGATAESALVQARAITEPKSFVIVEIGGNDFLGRTDSQTFRKQLDQLLGKLRSENHQVVMFELPLPPFYNAFGRAQRDLAWKYQVPLIPKSYLTRVFGSGGGTVDNLHLSVDGHRALANSIHDLLVIQKSIVPRKGNPNG